MNSGKVHLCIDSKTVIVDKDPEIEALLDNIPLRKRTHGYPEGMTYTCYAAVHKIKTNGFAILRVPKEFRTKKMLEDEDVACDESSLKAQIFGFLKTQKAGVVLTFLTQNDLVNINRWEF